MTIPGISASGRADSVTCDAVMAVLQASGGLHEFVSLAGKRIGDCRVWVACAKNNR